MTEEPNLPTERPKTQVDVVRGALERLKPQFAAALPKHLTPDRLVRIAMTAVQRVPKLLECDRTSFYGAIMTCAQLGLEPDGILGQAYLLPYRSKDGTYKAQVIPGYKGLLTLARNSGEISYIAAHEVRENDQFDFDFASGTPPVHKFSLKEDRGSVIAFYAIARFRDGSFHWDMMTVAEIDDIRDSSDGYRASMANAKRYNREPEGPWIDHYVEMAKKTCIRRLSKYLPLSVQKAAEIDAQVNAGMHVSLDRYGDLVIEGEAEPVEDDPSPKPTTKLERFEERHAVLRDDDVAERQDVSVPPQTPVGARPGDPIPSDEGEGSPAGNPSTADMKGNVGEPDITGPLPHDVPMPAGDHPLLSDALIEKRRRELRSSR